MELFFLDETKRVHHIHSHNARQGIDAKKMEAEGLEAQRMRAESVDAEQTEDEPRDVKGPEAEGFEAEPTSAEITEANNTQGAGSELSTNRNMRIVSCYWLNCEHDQKQQTKTEVVNCLRRHQKAAKGKLNIPHVWTIKMTSNPSNQFAV